MDIEIREYRDADYESCRSLYGELAQYAAEMYGDAKIAGEDAGRGFDEYIKRKDRLGSWIAVSDHKIVGFTGLIDVVGEEGLVEIEPVVVTASLRGKGIGSRLVEYAVEEAKRREIRFLSIKPEVRNERAFSLYVRLGFDKVGSIELFQDLSPDSAREWKSGIEIHGRSLRY